MDDEAYFDLLSLRRPTKLTELCASIPKPKGAFPPNGLPVWEELPLDAKLPMVPCPKGAIVFSRDKIGRKLWHSSAAQDFILYDPNCYDVSYKYDPLHDENLRVFFSQKRNRDRIRQLGLITKDGRAICTLRELNEYRRYLKRLHLDTITKECEFQDEMELERRLLLNGEKYEERNRELCIKADFRAEKSKAKNEDRISKQLQKEQKCAVRQKRYDLVVERQKQRKLEDQLRRRRKGQAFDEKISNRINNANTMERHRKIEALRRWHDTDMDKLSRLQALRKEKELEKEQRDLTHWEHKMHTQKLRLQYEKELLWQDKLEMERMVGIRNKNVEMQRIKMEEKLHKMKSKRKGRTPKDMLRAITRQMNLELMTGNDKAHQKLVEKTLQATLAELRNKTDATGVLSILQGTKEKLDREIIIPEDVSYVIEETLNNVIKEYVKRNVRSVINTVIDKSLQSRMKPTEDDRKRTMFENNTRGRRLSAVVTPGKSRSIINAEQGQSLTTYEKKTSTSSTNKVVRGVSFGAVDTIGSSIDEEDGTLTRVLSRIRDRPPTPVPSLTDLVEAVFKDQIPLDTTDESITERRQLEKLFQDFSKLLFKTVHTRATREYEIKYKGGHKKSTMRSEFKMGDIMNKVTDKILAVEEKFLHDSEEFQLVSEAVFQEVIKQYIAEDHKNMAMKYGSNGKKKV